MIEAKKSSTGTEIIGRPSANRAATSLAPSHHQVVSIETLYGHVTTALRDTRGVFVNRILQT